MQGLNENRYLFREIKEELESLEEKDEEQLQDIVLREIYGSYDSRSERIFMAQEFLQELAGGSCQRSG